MASTKTGQVGCNPAHSHICKDQLHQLPIYSTTSVTTHYVHGLTIGAGLPLRSEQQGRGTCKLLPAAVQLGSTKPSLCRPSTCNQPTAACMQRQYILYFDCMTTESKESSQQGQDVQCSAVQYKNDGRTQMQPHTFPRLCFCSQEPPVQLQTQLLRQSAKSKQKE